MIHDLLFFLGFFVASAVVTRVLYSRDLGPFNTLFNILGFFGIFVHELSHFMMCLVNNVPTSEFKVRYWEKDQNIRRVNPHGSVKLKEWRRITFLQALLIALAPLFLCTWICFHLLGVLLEEQFPLVLRMLAGLAFISLFIGASPSGQDLRQIPAAFSRNYKYSLLQLAILSLSAVLFFTLLAVYIAPFFAQISLLPLMPYVIIPLLYFLIKYGVKGIRTALRRTFRRKAEGSHSMLLTRRAEVDFKTPHYARFTRTDEDGVW